MRWRVENYTIDDGVATRGNTGTRQGVLSVTVLQSDHGCSEEERPQLIRVPDKVFYGLEFYVCGRHTWTSLTMCAVTKKG